MSGTFEYTFTAGQSRDYPGGRAFFVHDAGATDLTIRFYRRGQTIHEVENVGKSYRFVLEKGSEPFDWVRIIPTTAQTVLFEISSEGEGGSFTIGGSVTTTITQADALTHTTPTVNTTAAKIADASSTRKCLHVANFGANNVYIGGSSITTANGAIKIAPGEEHREESAAGAEWWAVADGATNDVRVMEGE